jgi:glycosyltransferase involved in cell wall biosynthesis
LRGIRALFRLVPYLARLWRACGRVQVVHVMANSGWSWHLFAAPAIRVARLRGRAVVVNYRGGLAREFLARSGNRVLGVLRHAQLVVPSGFLQQVFSEHGRPAVVVPNVVDLQTFYPATDASPDGFHIAVVRNLEHIYGIDLALRALALTRKQIPDTCMSIAGSGPDRPRYEALARELGVADCVDFTGSLSPAQIAGLLRRCTVVLNPVRADNMPNSVLEALACGVPVLSTRVGGVPFLVEHDHTAWLVEPESPLAIAEGLQRLYADAGLRSRLARQGRTVAEACAWPAVRDRWLEIYRAGMQGK